MGLTVQSVGTNALDCGLTVKKHTEKDHIIAIAGNPNVGKSTVFNGLTGLNQHTGNWAGKTVASAQGYCRTDKGSYVMVDIPGAYSLMAHSSEEEVARNFICFGGADAVVVVCDATCLERNLNLVLQTCEITSNVILCVNLMDEAARKHIHIDLKLLGRHLGIPVVGTSARRKKNLKCLTDALDDMFASNTPTVPLTIGYEETVESALALLTPVLASRCNGCLNERWLALKLLDQDPSLLKALDNYLGFHILEDKEVRDSLSRAKTLLHCAGLDEDTLRDSIVSSLSRTATELCADTVTSEKKNCTDRDRKADRLLTGRLAGYPVMIALLALIFWLTIEGANYPSQALSTLLFSLQEHLDSFLIFIGLPVWLRDLLADGIYRVLAWVVSVMLPPMAIFFPLFTLLEDVGYLPRIAYNLDYCFKKCSACGKQALTMAMGFGCNAAGVTGCRIIDSPRERLIAILTNSFVPCNGRFPALTAIITMFFLGSATAGQTSSSLLAALFLTGLILLGIIMTFLMSKLLSATILKGVPSSFTLELPPYRKPQIGRVIIRSLFDRTLFVLGRAAAVAAPAGMLIWLMANIHLGGLTLLAQAASLLDPFGRLMGLDGIILIAFILGLPANEIVIPLIIMGYLSQGSLQELNDLSAMKQLLTANGWTWITAVCTCLFSLMHWPCSTTLITIKRETGSCKWMFLAVLLPTAAGIASCILFNLISRLLLPFFQ